MTIGDRLKEERLKLGLSQTKIAEIGGVQKNSQINYEKNNSQPDAIYLEKISKIGCDILYIVTGNRGVICTEMVGLEEISLDDLEKTLELVQINLGGVIKVMKKVRKVNAD